MKRLLVLLLALLPLALPWPANAKGATDVVITGPGIDRAHLGFGRSQGSVSFEALTESTQVFGVFGSQYGPRPDLTRAELGPAYVLRWKIGRDAFATTRAYPFAETGAWAQVPAGQRIWGVDLASGWWDGGDELRDQLVALGATEPTASTASYDAAIAAVIARLAWAGVVLA